MCLFKDAGSQTITQIMRWSIMECTDPELTEEIQRLGARIKLLISHQTKGKSEIMVNQKPESSGPHCSRLVLQRRYRPGDGIPIQWTEWHDHPEPHQIAWGPGKYPTLEENMKSVCEGYYSLGQGCEFRMVRRTDETLWEYSSNSN